MFGAEKKNEKSDNLVREFAAGERIVAEGDDTHEMYIIQKGQVAIEKRQNGESLRLATLGKGDFFGEMSLLEGLPRSADAVALIPSRLLVLQSGGFLLKLRRDPTFAFEVIAGLSSRIRSMNDHLMLLMQESGIDMKTAGQIFARMEQQKINQE
ncbi:MAG: cyclic nucleotide-binding domain-containing protein [Desulfurivibrio sp.]|nr:cyclic nucleotide-binding domain-containing protein [Desulfurivibrio sp.]